MREYEVILVVESGYDDQNVDTVLGKFEELLTKEEGRIITQDRWGKRRLAYPINKKNYGYYVLYNLEMPGTGVQPIRRILDRREDVLRYIFVTLDARTKKLRAKQAQVKLQMEKRVAMRQAAAEKQVKPEKGDDK